MGTRRRFADAAGRRESLIVIGVSAVVLAAAAIAASAELTSGEVTVFRSINGLPEGLYRVVWPFMQYGTFITIPLLAIVALAFRRFRLALAVLARRALLPRNGRDLPRACAALRFRA